jgi:hypothetical protein
LGTLSERGPWLSVDSGVETAVSRVADFPEIKKLENMKLETYFRHCNEITHANSKVLHLDDIVYTYLQVLASK